jgi:hypothetical protein
MKGSTVQRRKRGTEAVQDFHQLGSLRSLSRSIARLWMFWRWVYATSYLRSKRKYGEIDAPGWRAVFVVSGVMVCNILTLLFLLTWILRVLPPREYVVVVLALVGALLAFNHSRFVRRGEANTLIRQLEAQGAPRLVAESGSSSRWNSALLRRRLH